MGGKQSLSPKPLAFILSWIQSLNLSIMDYFSDHLPFSVGYTNFVQMIIESKLWLFAEQHLDYPVVHSEM